MSFENRNFRAMRGDVLVFTACFFFSSIPIPRFFRRISRSWSVDSRRAEVSMSGVRSGAISKERSALEVSARFISSLAI